ncbi:MAG: hemolysin III family protein [Pseudomonadota bacterium]
MFPSKTAPERIADGLIHAVSLVAFAVVSVLLLSMAAMRDEPWVLGATIIYVIAAFASVCISFAYHLLPRHDLRPVLRRWDHAAIYIVIAGTFTPLLVLCDTWSAWALLTVIWICAGLGCVFKVFASQLDSRWSLVSYFGLGLLGLAALPDFWTQLPKATSYALLAGGVLYSIGTWYYRQKERRFRYPIWHAWGTLGATSFVTGIWIALAA